MKNLKQSKYEKAQKISQKYVNLSTAVKNCNGDSELVEIVEKIFTRKSKEEEKTVKQFCDNLIINRLRQIAKNLPDEGYSMGSKILVTVGKGKHCLIGQDDRTSEYAHSCKYSATHGRVVLHLKAEELRYTRVIANLVTYIYPNQKSKIKKCYWYVGYGSKSHFELKKKEGFIFAGFHAETKEQAKLGGERNIQYQKDQSKKVENFNKALRLQYSFEDSLKSGNCEAGTRAFILRLGLDSTKKYRGKFLLELAKEKSSNSVSYVERMVRYKVRK
jgi:hypothetical protein